MIRGHSIHRRHLMIAIATAFAVPSLLAGCGGSRRGSNTAGTEQIGSTEQVKPLSTGTLPKAAFIAKADRICTKEAERKNAALGNYIKKTNTELARLLSEPGRLAQIKTSIILPDYRAQVEGIRRLGAPKGDQKKVGAILDAMQEVINRIVKQPGNPTLGAYIFDPVGKARMLAKAYGFKVCPSP